MIFCNCGWKSGLLGGLEPLLNLSAEMVYSIYMSIAFYKSEGLYSSLPTSLESLDLDTVKSPLMSTGIIRLNS